MLGSLIIQFIQKGFCICFKSSAKLLRHLLAPPYLIHLNTFFEINSYSYFFYRGWIFSNICDSCDIWVYFDVFAVSMCIPVLCLDCIFGRSGKISSANDHRIFHIWWGPIPSSQHYWTPPEYNGWNPVFIC